MKISGTPISPQGAPAQAPGRVALSGQGDGGGAYSFTSGQLLKGEVVGLGPDGRVFLNIDGRGIEARSEVALRPGTVIWFEVQQTEPLWLRLADRKGTAQEFLRQYFSDPTAMDKGLRSMLDQALPTGGQGTPTGQVGALAAFADLAQGAEADPGRIIRMLATLGLVRPGAGGSEPGKIRELLAGLAGKSAAPEGTPDLAALGRLGQLLELQQQLNAIPVTPQQTQFFLLPCLFALGAGSGQWLLALDREDGREAAGEERGYTLSFFLTMSRLGELQIQLKVRGKALSGEFLVRSEEVREYLAPQLAGLADLLTGRDYGPVVFSCRIASHSLLESLKTGIEAAAQLERVRLVDLQA